MKNYMEVRFKAISENESFARTCVASFCLQLSPNLDELNDIRTAVSEAVTNCVVHAYPNRVGEVILRAEIEGNSLKVSITDHGIGIKDVARAREPFYTSKPDEERSGMGFTIMESFMDEMSIDKNNGRGVTVTLVKKIAREKNVVGEECNYLQKL